MDLWLTHQVRSMRALVVFTRVHLLVLGLLTVLFAVTDSVVAGRLDTYLTGLLLVGVGSLLVALIASRRLEPERHWWWALLVPPATSVGIVLASPVRPGAETLPALMQVFVVVTVAQIYRARLTAVFTALAVVCANLSALRLSDPVLAAHIQLFATLSLVFTGTVLVLLCERVDAQTRALEVGIQLDPLTGLHSRADFEQNFADLVRQEEAEPAVLLLIDVDDFKSINDAGGHPAGDRALVLVADLLRAELASPARLWRIGGDEFAAWCPTQGRDPVEYAAELVQRVRSRASQTNLPDDPEKQLGLSVGAVRVNPGPSVRSRDVFAAADADLYRHKALARVTR